MIALILFAFILPALVVYTVLGNKLSRTERNRAEILTRVYIAFTIIKLPVIVLIPMLWFFIIDNKEPWIKIY